MIYLLGFLPMILFFSMMISLGNHKFCTKKFWRETLECFAIGTGFLLSFACVMWSLIRLLGFK